MVARTCRARRPIPAALAGALAFALLGGCGPRDRDLNPSPFTIAGQLAPAGVVLPKSLDGGPDRNYDGLYAELPATSICCWIAPRATIYVRKETRYATTLVAGFYIPGDIPRFAGGQRLRFTFPGASRSITRVLGTSQHSVHIPVPAQLRQLNGPIPVRIDAAVEYVPARDASQQFSWRRLVGLKPPPSDPRRLAAVLLYAYIR